MSICRHGAAMVLWAIACAWFFLPAWCAPPDAPVGRTILFVGDTSFGENYQLANQQLGETNILEQRGYDYPLAKLKPFLMQADWVIANLETPITSLRRSPFDGTKTYVHWSDVVLAPQHLKKHNVHAVSLANNHTLDFGAPGLGQTLDALTASQIEVFGAGRNEQDAAKPLLKDLTVDGQVFKMAVFAAFEYSVDYDRDYHFYARGDRPGANVLALETFARQIAQLKATDPDRYVVVFPHWGENYVWKSTSQADMAHGLVDAGADLVVGHGAHMMQEIEPYRGRWIVYSVGNFMFNSPGRYRLKAVDPFSLVAQLRVRADDGRLATSVRLHPIFTDNRITNYQSRPVTKEEFDRVLALLAAKCPEPTQFKQLVRQGKDDLGYFLEFATPTATDD